jgi:hypothetical protein
MQVKCLQLQQFVNKTHADDESSCCLGTKTKANDHMAQWNWGLFPGAVGTAQWSGHDLI